MLTIGFRGLSHKSIQFFLQCRGGFFIVFTEVLIDIEGQNGCLNAFQCFQNRCARKRLIGIVSLGSSVEGKADDNGRGGHQHFFTVGKHDLASFN